MKLYLVRHGETDSNIDKVHQHTEVPLNQTGVSQAEIVAGRFLKIHTDVILSSPNLRAKQTAEIIASHIDKKIICTPLLVERRRPSEILGKQIDDPQIKQIKDSIWQHISDPGWHYSDEENFFDIKKRIQEFFKYLEGVKYESVLAVSHTVTIRTIISLILMGELLTPEIFLRTYSTLQIENTGITVCEKDGVDDWKLVTWNDYAHLG